MTSDSFHIGQGLLLTFADLPDSIEVRLVTKTIKGKEVNIITSLTDPMRFLRLRLLTYTVTDGK